MFLQRRFGEDAGCGVAQAVEGCAACRRPVDEAARAPARLRPLRPGDIVAGYRLRRLAGQGSMGVVYEAEDLRLLRRVALKFGSPRLASEPRLAARLLREARTAAALEHPNIGTIYEVGEHEGRTFIGMAFIDGDTLAQRIARGPVDPVEALGLWTQLVSALACAHAAGVVHRDVKPANVMLTRTGEVKVLDFGLAALLAADDVGATADGELMGTLGYMAPEQLARGPIDARADVWALGVTLVELWSGRRPFGGVGPMEIAHAVLHAEPRLPELPPAIERIVDRCLHKDRDRRYADGGELLADLERLQRSAPRSPRRPTRGSRRRGRIDAVG